MKRMPQSKPLESAAPQEPSEKTALKQWRPDAPAVYAPYRPGGWLNISNFLAYFFGYPGFLWPWTTIYFSVVVLTYTYAFPQDLKATCSTFEPGWIAATALRNLVRPKHCWTLRTNAMRRQLQLTTSNGAFVGLGASVDLRRGLAPAAVHAEAQQR